MSREAIKRERKSCHHRDRELPRRWGYSALVYPLFGGAAVRKTLYFIRDERGYTQRVLILDAKEAF